VIIEPVVRLHRLLIQRHEPELVAGRAGRVWEASTDTIAGKIYGPHFEDLWTPRLSGACSVDW
jgi:hypothetical protein